MLFFQGSEGPGRHIKARWASGLRPLRVVGGDQHHGVGHRWRWRRMALWYWPLDKATPCSPRAVITVKAAKPHAEDSEICFAGGFGLR